MGDEGTPRRLAARVHGERGTELSAFLARRRPRTEQIDLTVAALQTGEVRIIEIDAGAMGALAHDDREAGAMAAMALTHWVNVPLRAGDQLVGSLGLGLRASRTPPEEQRPFFEALSERAARGVAHAKLVSELQRTRSRLERILGALAEAVTVNDAHGNVVYANPAAARLLGASSVEEVLAAEPGELAARFIISREDGSPVREDELPGHRLLSGLDAQPLLTRSVRRDNGQEYWLLTKATVLDDEGLLAVNIIEDVTEAKTAELRQRFLAEAGELLVASPDYAQTLERVAGLAVPTLADWCAVDLVAGGGLERVAIAHVDPEKRRLAEQLHERHPAALAAALRDGRSRLFPEVTDEMLVESARDDKQLHLLREIGMRSAMFVPMRVGERSIGVLTFATAESLRAFDEADLAFAEDIARRAAPAVENARRYGGSG